MPTSLLSRLRPLSAQPWWSRWSQTSQHRGGKGHAFRPTLEKLECRIALSVSVRQFDFNTATSPNEPGWTSLKMGDVFNETTGIGWETALTSDTYDARARGDDVIKDGHKGSVGKLKVLVNPGQSYHVDLIFRDKKAQDFQVAVEGSAPVVVRLPRQATVVQSFPNLVSSDPILTIDFTALAAGDSFIINGLRIVGETVVLNRPPIARDDAASVDEDSEASIDVLANDSDPDGDTLGIVSFTQPGNGQVSTLGNQAVYRPNPNYFGTDRFTYKITDGRGGTSLGTVTVVVREVNDPPVANPDSGQGFTTVVNQPLTTASVLTNDFDPDPGDIIAITQIDTAGTVGTVTWNGDGTFHYAPPAGYLGTDVFRYTITDTRGASASAPVTITIRDVAATRGIWVSAAEIMALPASGPAWDALLKAANSPANAPLVSNQDDNTDVITLAKALVGVRLAQESYLTQARANIMAAIGTEVGGRTLALGRNLASYIIAAELAGLSPQEETTFRQWLRTTLTENLDGRTLQSTHEDRPNNWGTMAGGSRAAVAVYLQDPVELERVAKVFKGWLGDRASYAGFKYGSDLSWQADPSRPVGINPKGAMKEGHSIDGALPDEMRRGGSFTWPPAGTGYPWEGLQGALVQAEILHRAGYDAWQWEDRALLRAVNFLYGIGWPAEGDDQWQPWLINARYGANLAVNPAAGHGKIIGWTSWTHAPAATAAAGLSVIPLFREGTLEEQQGGLTRPTSGETQPSSYQSSRTLSAAVPDSQQAPENPRPRVTKPSRSGPAPWTNRGLSSDGDRPLLAAVDQFFAGWDA